MSGASDRRTLLLAVAVAAAALAVQLLGALPGVFLWDDLALVAQSDLYTAPGRWVESVSNPLGMETGYWRPAATTSFLLESLVHGGSASGFRVTAALLHALSACAVTLLLARLLASRTAAVLAGLAWALHPAHVETATWISSRFDLLAGLFGFAALLWLGAAGRACGKWPLRCIAVFSALALLSKENAVVLPFALAAWSLAASPPENGLWDTLRARWRTWAACGAGLVAVVVVRLERLQFVFRAGEGSVEDAGSVLQHLLLVGRAFATYAHLLLMPWGVAGPAHHAARPIPSGDPLGWVGVIMLAATVAGTVLLVRRRARTGYLLAGFLLTLLPVLQIVPLDLAGGLHAADRYLYLPSLFGVAAVADAVLARVRARDARRVAGATLAVVLALLVGRIATARPWRSPFAFWRKAVAMAPQSTVTLGNLSLVLLGEGWPDAGRLAEAEDVARRLHRLDSLFGHAYVLAEVLIAQRRHLEADQLVANALRVRGSDVKLLLLRGRTRADRGDFVASREAFERAAEEARRQAADGTIFDLTPEALAGAAEAVAGEDVDPFVARRLLGQAEGHRDAAAPAARVQRARAWLRLGEPERALAALGDGRFVPSTRWGELLELAAWVTAGDEIEAHIQEMALRAGMPEAQALRSRGMGHELAERWDRAEAFYRRVTELLPEYALAWDHLGYALYFLTRETDAETAFRRALEVQPALAGARMHLGVLLRRTGRPAEGVEELRRALADAEAAGDDELVRRVQLQLDIAAQEDGGD